METKNNNNLDILEYIKSKDEIFFVFYNLDKKTKSYLEEQGYQKLKTNCRIYTKVDLYFDKPGEIQMEFDFSKKYKKYNNLITNYDIQCSILNNIGFDKNLPYNKQIEKYDFLQRYCYEDEDEFVAENNYLVIDIDNCGFEKHYYLDFIMMIKQPTTICQDNELIEYFATTDNNIYVVEHNTLTNNEEITKLLLERNYIKGDFKVKISKDMYNDYSIKKVIVNETRELKRNSETYKTTIDIMKNNKGFTDKYNINTKISEEDLFEIFSTIDENDKSINLIGIVNISMFKKMN